MKAHFCFAYLHHDAALKSVFRKLKTEGRKIHFTELRGRRDLLPGLRSILEKKLTSEQFISTQRTDKVFYSDLA